MIQKQFSSDPQPCLDGELSRRIAEGRKDRLKQLVLIFGSLEIFVMLCAESEEHGASMTSTNFLTQYFPLCTKHLLQGQANDLEVLEKKKHIDKEQAKKNLYHRKCIL